MTRRRRRWILAAIAAIAVALALGCGLHQTSPSEPVVQPDSIVIDSISPLPGTRLAPGSTVTFGTVLSYAVHENLGGGVIVQLADQNGILLANDFPSISLAQGTGTVTLASQFQIPSSGTTRITIDYILLATPGETSEIVAATKLVNYPVGR
ncbi:MAG TPA: hypothetical protein VJA16_22725 [Thermoanaerobaculia bacterium]